MAVVLMKVILFSINISIIIMLMRGAFRLKSISKSSITQALFALLVCLCLEIAIVTILLFLDPVTIHSTCFRIIARLFEVGGALWFLRSFREGEEFVEGMLYRDKRARDKELSDEPASPTTVL